MCEQGELTLHPCPQTVSAGESVAAKRHRHPHLKLSAHRRPSNTAAAAAAAGGGGWPLRCRRCGMYRRRRQSPPRTDGMITISMSPSSPSSITSITSDRQRRRLAAAAAAAAAVIIAVHDNSSCCNNNGGGGGGGGVGVGGTWLGRSAAVVAYRALGCCKIC